MALAESMKTFVNDLKRSRSSRHEFVKGNREIAKNIMADNRKFLENIRMQNKVNAEQTHEFLKSAKKTRAENYKESQASIKETLLRVHQSTAAIKQGALEMIKELREENKMAHSYWASLESDDPIVESKESNVSKNFKKSESKNAHNQDREIDVVENKDETK